MVVHVPPWVTLRLFLDVDTSLDDPKTRHVMQATQMNVIEFNNEGLKGEIYFL